MDKGIILALLNPAISLIFATGFFLLWRHQRDRRYILLLVGWHVLASTGFLLQYFTLPIGFAATKLLSNVCFMTAGLLLSAGVLNRLGRPVPWALLGSIAATGMATFCWFLFIDPDLTFRVYAINFAFGAMCFAVVDGMRRAPGKSLVERVLMIFLILTGVSFFVRTIALVWVEGGYQTYDGFYTSIYWMTTAVFHAVFSVLVAVCLVTAIALDIFGKLRTESLSDALSGVLNRRGFEEGCDRLLAEAAISGLPVTLVLCDLDHFKEINDTHGHAAGDLVITAFGEHLASAAGATGIVGRIGGEEFAVLLPGNGLSSARLFAEGLRVSFAATSFASGDTRFNVTASFGVAALASGDTLSSLLVRADQALYQAKSSGRDCVRISLREAIIPPLHGSLGKAVMSIS